MDDDVPEITPTALKARLDRGEAVTIIDVREPYEWEIGNLGEFGARLVPLEELPELMKDLDPGEDIVLQCRSGSRSARATKYMRQRGFRNVHNLRGGILAWADEIDPSIPKY
jgi:sulfur-carrier protein adenylyltransferase/sulfurtransferase